jgi:hypothetical protein
MWTPKRITPHVYDFIIPTRGIYHTLSIGNGNVVPSLAVQYGEPATFLLNLFTFIKDETYFTSYSSFTKT